MTPLRFLTLSALAGLVLAGCVSTPTKAAFACQQTVQTAELAAFQLAENRIKQMEVIRFASQEAMEAYTAETERLKTESVMLSVDLASLANIYGEADYAPDTTVTLDAETVDALIAKADACASKLLE